MHRSTKAWIWLVTAILLSVASQASAASLPIPGAPGQRVNQDSPGFPRGIGGGFVAQGFPLQPMQEKTWYFKIVPGYFRDSSDRIPGVVSKYAIEGYGVTGEALYSFSPHWGINFIASYMESANGTDNMTTVGPLNNPSSVFSNSLKYRQTLAVMQLVYDPFDGDNFRLPIWAGPALTHVYRKSEGTFQIQGNTFRSTFKTDSAGVSLAGGLSPQWNWGTFRFAPFATFVYPATQNSYAFRLENLSNGQVAENSGDVSKYLSMHAGMAIKYLPWNLGFTYVRGNIVLDSNQRAFVGSPDLYTISWDYTWGSK